MDQIILILKDDLRLIEVFKIIGTYYIFVSLENKSARIMIFHLSESVSVKFAPNFIGIV